MEKTFFSTGSLYGFSGNPGNQQTLDNFEASNSRNPARPLPKSSVAEAAPLNQCIVGETPRSIPHDYVG